ncbi:MAG: hypothetical protein K5636_00055 [Bacteroidales bacterium]|nr:hypothetical protein [Bacteroidales bacterium]
MDLSKIKETVKKSGKEIKENINKITKDEDVKEALQQVKKEKSFKAVKEAVQKIAKDKDVKEAVKDIGESLKGKKKE